MDNYKWTKLYLDNRIKALKQESAKLDATISELYDLAIAIETHEDINICEECKDKGWIDSNDSKEELRDAAQFIHSVSPDIPWHVTAFHKDYKMQDPENTTAQTLIEAAELGYAEGLHYVYAGNAAGRVGRLENTYCHSCSELLIERIGYVIQSYHITSDGRCSKCSQSIPGIWPKNREDVRLGDVSDLFLRVPRLVR